MKFITALIIGALLLFSEKHTNAADLSSGDTLKVFSSPELLDITNKWVSEFGRLNTGLNIRVNLATGYNYQESTIVFASVNKTDMAKNKNWNMVIGHDVIVPVMNAKNPMRDEITKQGISPDEFSRFFRSQGRENWSSMIKNGQTNTVNLYMLDNKSVINGMEAFGKLEAGSLTGKKVMIASDFITAIEKDLYSIGFCRLSDISNINSTITVLQIIPIDKNGNGILDNFENIYENAESVSRGAWIGKYPNSLCGDIYAISKIKPADQNTLALLNWILAEGGHILNSNGYADLASMEKTMGINALMSNDFTIARDDSPKMGWLWLIFITIFIAAGLVLKLVIGGVRTEKTIGDNNIRVSANLSENIIAAPKGLFFDKSHTWAFLEKDGYVRVGIDDFIQHITGKITRIKMREAGEMVRKGEKIITIIRDGKQIDIYAPVSGMIKEKNNALLTDSSLLNTSPYAEGWIYMIEPRNWSRETEFLFMSEKYMEWIKSEFIRLKDFFALTVNSNKNAYAHIVLQDGGELTDNILADLGPEVWEDFQTKFIDTSR